MTIPRTMTTDYPQDLMKHLGDLIEESNDSSDGIALTILRAYDAWRREQIDESLALHIANIISISDVENEGSLEIARTVLDACGYAALKAERDEALAKRTEANDAWRQDYNECAAQRDALKAERDEALGEIKDIQDRLLEQIDGEVVAHGGLALARYIHRGADYGMDGETAYERRKDDFDGQARAILDACGYDALKAELEAARECHRCEDYAEERDQLRTTCDALQAENKALMALLAECADDLEAELTARYSVGGKIHPSMQRDFDRDMDTVIRARAALKTGGTT